MSYERYFAFREFERAADAIEPGKLNYDIIRLCREFTPLPLESLKQKDFEVIIKAACFAGKKDSVCVFGRHLYDLIPGRERTFL